MVEILKALCVQQPQQFQSALAHLQQDQVTVLTSSVEGQL